VKTRATASGLCGNGRGSAMDSSANGSASTRVLYVLFYALLLLFAVFYLLPFWGALTTSLKQAREVAITNPLAFPSSPTFSPYLEAFAQLKRPLLNSVLITVGGTLGSVFLGSICGYAFAKYRFRYDNLIFTLLVSAIFLPYQAILVPLFQTIRALGLYNTIPGLILVHTAYGIPMCALMFRGFYGDVPDCLIKQAMMDGNGPWRIYTKIVLPSTKIATVTVLVFQFTSIWNEMLFGLIIGGPDSMPATIALNNMMGTLAAEWNVQMAGSMWLALPVLILYIAMGKYLIRGYMAGAVTAS